MSDIRIHREHALGLAKARKIAWTWAEEVEAKLPDGEFKLAELASAIDREVTTTRNYLSRLVADGKVHVTGEDASGRGKPAKIYRKS